eukprot:s788_g21.t1
MPRPARPAVPEPPLAPEASWETSGSSGEAVDAESATEAVPSRWPLQDDRPLPDDEGAPTQRGTRARWQSKTAVTKLLKVEKAFKQLKSEVTRLRRRVRKRSLSDEGLLLPSEAPAPLSEEAPPRPAPRLPAPSVAAPELVPGSEAPSSQKKEHEERGEGPFSPGSRSESASESSEQPAPLEDVRTASEAALSSRL